MNPSFQRYLKNKRNSLPVTGWAAMARLCTLTMPPIVSLLIPLFRAVKVVIVVELVSYIELGTAPPLNSPPNLTFLLLGYTPTDGCQLYDAALSPITSEACSPFISQEVGLLLCVHDARSLPLIPTVTHANFIIRFMSLMTAQEYKAVLILQQMRLFG